MFQAVFWNGNFFHMSILNFKCSSPQELFAVNKHELKLVFHVNCIREWRDKKLCAQDKYCVQKTGRLQTTKCIMKTFLGRRNKNKPNLYQLNTCKTDIPIYFECDNTWNSLRFGLLEKVYLLSKKLFSAANDSCCKENCIPYKINSQVHSIWPQTIHSACYLCVVFYI
jgi:hypothetical protein